MKRYAPFLLALLALIVVAAPLGAHERFRIIGTVTKVEARAIDVKKKDGKTTSMSMDKQTKVNIDKKKATTSDLEVGQSVVVDAYGDDESDLLAVDIRIVPPIAPKAPAPKTAPKTRTASAPKKD
jgi:hypothetical protein